MRRIPDIVIAAGVIIGATGIAIGYRWVGGISLLVALIVGWKRKWCLDAFEEMSSSSESSAVNRMRRSDADHVADGAAGGNSGAGGDGD